MGWWAGETLSSQAAENGFSTIAACKLCKELQDCSFHESSCMLWWVFSNTVSVFSHPWSCLTPPNNTVSDPPQKIIKLASWTSVTITSPCHGLSFWVDIDVYIVSSQEKFLMQQLNTLSFQENVLFCVYMISVWHTCHSTCVKVRGQVCGINSFLQCLRGLQGWNSIQKVIEYRVSYVGAYKLTC